MKFRNGVLMMTAAALVLQASGATEVQVSNADQSTIPTEFAVEMNYQDVTKSTPNYQAIFQLKELGFLNLGDEFQPTSKITYGHLAYILATSQFEFGQLHAPLGPEGEANDDFHVYQASAEYLVGKGLFDTNVDLNAEVTHEGLAKIAQKAFNVETSMASLEAMKKIQADVGNATEAVQRHHVASYFYQGFLYKSKALIIKDENKEETVTPPTEETVTPPTEEVVTPPTQTVTPPTKEAVTVAQTKEFTDVKTTHWAYKNIQNAVAKGYVAGYPDGTFKPEQAVSNSEFMKMLVAGLGHDVPSQKGQNWYAEYLKVALKEGYLKEAYTSTIHWGGLMSRTNVVDMSLSFLGKTPSNPKKAWYVATDIGLMVGMDAKGTLGEDKQLTRAQSVTIVERMIQLKNGGTLTADKHAKSVAEVKYHRTNMFTFLSHLINEREVDLIQERMFKQSFANGAYTTESLGNYLIDLSDPNDPYRHLLANRVLYGGQSLSSLNTGFVQAIHYKVKATSNPSNLPVLDSGEFVINFGVNPLDTARTPKETDGGVSFYNGVTSGENEYIHLAYYPQSVLEKPKYIAFDTSEPAFISGKPTNHYLRYFYYD